MIWWVDREVLVTGSSGFLGSRVYERLEAGRARVRRYSRDGLNTAKTDTIIHCAGLVGGMLANRERPADFIRENLKIGLEVIERYRGARFINIGSSCAYPGQIWNQMSPDELWSGYPAKENGPYGVAKRTMMEVVRAYVQQYGITGFTLVFPNLYGPGMNMDLGKGHAIAGLIRRFWEAKEGKIERLELMGTGNAVREFMYVDDAVDAILEFGKENMPSVVNIGCNSGVTIKELADVVRALVGYEGEICWGNEKDDGQAQKVMRTTVEFMPKTPLVRGLKETIGWFIHRQTSESGQPEYSSVR